jgi:superfamily II DNA helicase RecQ
MKVLSQGLSSGQLASFRDVVLQEVVHYATTTNYSMLVVTATGSGKGAVILGLGAHNSAQGRWTIVTVPLRPLLDDLLRRAKALGLIAYEWAQVQDPRHWGAHAGLLFITPERCTEVAFTTFLRLKTEADLIAHVIHDEAHYRITWATFR